MEDDPEEQQYCLRWNNFQANITSQFEALREDEDFTDVTIVCNERSIQAHRVVLSACSPLFKQLFKNNPCSHPIIFMRDTDARSIAALMEFMYAGEVNVAQAHLSAFLRTAESLKIRGLTDPKTESTNKQCTKTPNDDGGCTNQVIDITHKDMQPNKPEEQQAIILNNSTDCITENNNESCANHSNLTSNNQKNNTSDEFINLDDEVEADVSMKQMKIELPEFSEYFSDVDIEDEGVQGHSGQFADCLKMEVKFTQEAKTPNSFGFKDGVPRPTRFDSIIDSQPKLTCADCGRCYSTLSNLRQHMRLIHFPTNPTCTICNKRYKTDLYLKRHLQYSHDYSHDAASSATTALAPRTFRDVSITKHSPSASAHTRFQSKPYNSTKYLY